MDVAVNDICAHQFDVYATLASLSILIFDYFETLDLEIKHVWGSNVFAGNVIFYINRYSPFVDVPLRVIYYLRDGMSVKSCFAMYQVVDWTMSLGMLISDVILLLRTCALYDMKRSISIFLAVVLVSTYIPSAVILGMVLAAGKSVDPSLLVHGCFFVEGSDILFIAYMLFLLNETIMFVLILWKGFQRYRHSRNPLVIVLYRDGILYFALIFATSVAYIIIKGLGPKKLFSVLVTVVRVLHSVLTSRIILHVREVAYTDRGDGTSTQISRLIAFSP